MNSITVRSHPRRKPAKPSHYVAKHDELRRDVEAMRRGDLPTYRTPGLFRSVAEFIRSRIGRG
jgi:hypothetical protein